MSNSRFVLHPVMIHKRSRFIFLYFLLLAIFLGTYLGYEFRQIIKAAGLDLTYGAPSRQWFLSMILSTHFQVAIVFLAAVFASALTAQFVVGPIKRMEQWISDWQAGKPLNPFRVRGKDKFSKLAELINLLHSKLNS